MWETVRIGNYVCHTMFSPMDILFYALAAMAGWKYSVVQDAV